MGNTHIKARSFQGFVGVPSPRLPKFADNVPRHAVDAGGLEPGAHIAITLPPAALRILG